jgi:hypothetical protein
VKTGLHPAGYRAFPRKSPLDEQRRQTDQLNVYRPAGAKRSWAASRTAFSGTLSRMPRQAKQ